MIQEIVVRVLVVIAAVLTGLAGLWLFWPFLALVFFTRRSGFGRHYSSYGRRHRVTVGRWF